MMARVGHHRSFLGHRVCSIVSVYVAKGGKRTTRPVTTLSFT
jgi:hypothetical protein